MSSNDNITEILSRFSSSASQLADLIGRSSSDNGVSNAFSNALDTPLSDDERPIRSASCEAELEDLLSISVILSFELILT